MSSTRQIFFITALAIMTSLMFVLFFGIPPLGPDAIQYDRIAHNLVSGHGFSSSQFAPFLPTMFREPVYPLFLAVIYRLCGHSVRIIVIMQMIIHAVTALLTYRIAREIFPERAALFSGIGVAIFPTLANTSLYILSETLFTFILVLSVSIYYAAFKEGRALRFAAAGALFGILALTKAAALFLPFTLIACTIASCIARKCEIKRFGINILTLLMVFLVVISGWAVRNNIRCGAFALTLRSGQALWSRAQKVDYSAQKILATACYSFSEYLGNRFFPDPAHRPERYLYEDLDKAKELDAKYMHEGMTESQADALLKKEAFEKISRHPARYACYTFVEAIKMTAFTYLPALNEQRVYGYFGKMGKGRLALSALKGFMRMLAFPIIILYIAGAVKNYQSWYRWLPIFMAVVYFNLACSLIDAIGRYGVPLIPLYCIFAMAALCPSHEQEMDGR